MTLIPQSLINRIPPLYATEDEGDPTVWVKLFFPDFHWTWYVTEYDGEDLCFGLVAGAMAELGYFRLSELRTARGKLGCRIERDRFFKPRPLSEVVSKYAWCDGCVVSITARHALTEPAVPPAVPYTELRQGNAPWEAR